MAGSKSYTLTFLLKAAADSSFQAAFNSAKHSLSEMQQQIKANNSILGDIGSYQKAQAAVEGLRQKVDEKRAAYEAARAAASAAGGADDSLNAKEAKLKTAFEASNLKLTEREKQLQNQAAALQKAGVDTGNLAQEQQRLAQATEQLKKEQEAQAEQQNRLFDQVAQMEALAAEAYVAIQAVEKLGEAWKACIDAAGGFQFAMSGVEAVMGASSGEMTRLSAMAKDLGANTKFTATEIAEALEYMGLAGWTAQESIEGMPAVANLAAAAGEDLSRVSDIVTDSMGALGYSTSETSHFCDVLAQTARKSNTNVDKMGDALKYAASTSGVLSYSIEDVATVMALMANNGIKAGMAGTALRNILANLAAPSNDAAEALEALDIHIADSEGNAYSLSNVVEQLRDRFAGLTQQEQVAYAATIAGKRGMAGLLAVVNATESDYVGLAEAIADCNGAAQQMAETRLDNYEGQVVILESAFDALKTSIGEAFLPAMQDGAESLTELTNAANGFVKENHEVVVGATAAAGAFGAMAVGVTAVATAVKLFSFAFMGTPLADLGMWAILGAGAAMVGVAAAIHNMQSETENLTEKIGKLAEVSQTAADNDDLIQEYQRLSKELADASGSEEELAETRGELNSVTAELKAAFPDLLGGIDAETEAWDRQLKVVQQLNEAEAIQAAQAILSDTGAVEAYTQAKKESAEWTQKAAEYDAAWNAEIESGGKTKEYYSKTISDLYDQLNQDVKDKTIAINYTEGSDFRERLDEMAKYASEASGTEIEFKTPQSVTKWLDEFEDSAYNSGNAAVYFSQKWREATEQQQESQGIIDDTNKAIRTLVDNGLSTVTEATAEYGATMHDLGYTYEDVAKDILVNGMSVTEAAKKYGITVDGANVAVRKFSATQERLAAKSEGVAESTKTSTRHMLQLGFAESLVTDGLMDAEYAAEAYGLSVDELNDYIQQVKTNEEKAAAATALVENGYMDADAAAAAFGLTVEEVDLYNARAEMESLAEELQTLQENYQKAYESALTSIQGQGSLLEGLSLDADRTKLTLSDALQNMQEIGNYWADYHSNLEALQGYGLSTDFLTRYCDTSSDGVANTEDLYNALESLSAEDRAAWIEDLNEGFETMVGKEETAAQTTADMETQYTATADAIMTRYQELQEEVVSAMQAMAQDMNRSSEASTSGSATAWAYANSLQPGFSSAIARARATASEVAAILASANSGGGKAAGGFTHGPELAGEDPNHPVEAVISFNPQYREANIGYLKQAAKMLGVADFTNTQYMNDGTAYRIKGFTDYGADALGLRKQERAEYQGGGSSHTTVSVDFRPEVRIDGTEDGESLRSQLMGYVDELEGMVNEAIDRREKNARRRSFGRGI